MPSIISETIRSESLKLIRRHQQYSTALAENIVRIRKRTGRAPVKNILTPTYWTCDCGFDPYHVRQNHERIGAAVKNRIRTGSYRPYPAVFYERPKPDGSMREVAVFQIPDNAV